MQPKMISSSDTFLNFEWPAVEGAEEYNLNVIADHAGEDPVNVDIQKTNFKFNNLRDGSMYSISMYARNEDTTSVRKEIDAWTNLRLPKVLIMGFEDTHFELALIQAFDPKETSNSRCISQCISRSVF